VVEFALAHRSADAAIAIIDSVAVFGLAADPKRFTAGTPLWSDSQY